ncbi:hypothetical protein [Streptomyces uncialis]|uniref:hypothetical protein n=1 Tax=Streptomyces uncialis TaxID=1048205 RepID=UPI0022580D64|nr:hypothetical protein [Streptomyces uncialis]MCX4664713.1 hypothetical protein [Streptomyces uncialis]
MFTRGVEGLERVPVEHARVLALYRDGMPLVYEPQFSGDEGLYPLVDTDTEPCGTAAGALEVLARSAAGRLRAARLGGDAAAPDLEGLARASVRGLLDDLYQFAAAVHHGDSDRGHGAAGRAVADAAAALGTYARRAAQDITASHGETREATA